jgi:hypothetical protein
MYETISLTSPNHWSIGSLMTCSKVDVGNVPSDAVCEWEDEGSTYCLRKRLLPRTERSVKGDPVAGRVRKSMHNSAWILSPNVFCKIMWWVSGSTTDAETIRFVNENIPSIPTEKIVYDWIDEEWRRSFMLTQRAPGTRNDEAWPLLTTEQKLGVAAQVAKHAKALAEFTSDFMGTVTGRGFEGQHSLRHREDLPEWKPRIEGKASSAQYRAFLKRKHGIETPDFNGPFVLQHPDLNPTNFFVTFTSDEVPKVTAIIDWSNVGYQPKFYVATLPSGRYWFAVEDQLGGADWMWMLSNALVDEGFPLEMEHLRKTMPAWTICGGTLPDVVDSLDKPTIQ